MRPLRICLVAAEAAPFAKTGGLADVITGLGRFLFHQGHDVRVFLPLYRRIATSGLPLREVPGCRDVEIRFPQRVVRMSLKAATLPNSDAPLLLIDCPELYDRDALYTNDPDEALRFALLNRGVLEACQRLQWAPDVLHCNDWHAGLLPLYARTVYGWDRLFHAARTVLTIHNVGYHGSFPVAQLDAIGLGAHRSQLHQRDLRDGRFSFLKTGVLLADKLTTVSRTYAFEIQTPEGGAGLDELLRTRTNDLVGIVNGVDYGDWDPANDPHLPHRYTRDDPSGKLRMKAALLDRMRLPFDPRAPVFGVVTRLTAQKGIELLGEVMPPLLQHADVRLCALGSGEDAQERMLQWLRDGWPRQVAIYRGYHEELAHWIEAGSDVFLMPSRYEPCGLNQMYSLRYGTPPIVRRTGGLADTVQPWDPATHTGTGFLFDEFSARGLAGTIDWALRNWRDQQGWRQLMQNGMAQDFSWDKQGQEYVALYRSLVG